MNTFDDRRSLHRFPSAKLDPWIFYSHGKRNRAHTFYSLSERRVHNKCIKQMVNNDIMCSMHGWLVLSNQIDCRSCQLFNPVSMATIQLPLLAIPIPSYYLFCALSCDPNNPNCIIMLIKCEMGIATCYFCRPGDVVWTEKDLELEKRKVCSRYIPDFIRSVGCYKDQICIHTGSEKIFLLAIDPPYLILTDLGVEHIRYNPGHYRTFEEYMVESDGELFLIQRFDLRGDAYDFVVFKLDVSGKKNRLVVVKNLGGRTFFLSSFSSGISCSSEEYGIKANTIYFTRIYDPCVYSFDMQKKVLTFSLPCPNVKRNLVQAHWIFPLSLNSPCKIDYKLDIISPLKTNKSTMLQPSISRSIRKDLFRLRDDTSNFDEVKLSSRFFVSDWSELPFDVLMSIAKKSSCVSCARISTVCKRWKSYITWAPKKLLSCPTFLHMPSSSIEAFYFMNKIRYNLHLPENPEVLNIQHAKDGWLLMTRYCTNEIFFLNPLTAEKIEIPYIPYSGIRGLCFTSLPTSSDCSVLGICECPLTFSHYLVYHICRGQNKWTEVEIFEAIVDYYDLIPYSNPVFHHGVFYWIWSSGNLCAYDPRKGKVELLVEPRSPSKYVHISYLCKSEEKLMSVLVGLHGKWIRVYELDEVSVTWKEVKTLKNKVIFLSRNSSLVTEIQGLEDMICFNRFFDDDQPLTFSLKTGELGVYGIGHYVVRDFCNISEYQIKSAWIMPNIKQHSDQELSW